METSISKQANTHLGNRLQLFYAVLSMDDSNPQKRILLNQALTEGNKAIELLTQAHQ